MISLGQPAFIGIADYGVFTLLDLSPVTGIVVGGLAASLFVVVMSPPLFNMSGALQSVL